MTLSRLPTGSILVVLTLALNIPVPAQKKRETPPPQWEHTVTYGCERPQYPSGKSNLQEMGEYGWELASVAKDGDGNSTCYFKRPKREGGYPEPPKKPEPAPTAPKCSLTVAQALTIRGIRLGMSLQELLALFPVSRYNTTINQQLKQAENLPEKGRSSLYFTLSQYPEGEARFAGISSIDLTLFDRRVVSFGIKYVYDEQAAWTRESWVRKLAGAFNLPPYENWATSCNDCPAVLHCGGITITASPRSVSLSDPSYVEELSRRAAAVAGQKQREFKP
jgi:hypothetical protein